MLTLRSAILSCVTAAFIGSGCAVPAADDERVPLARRDSLGISIIEIANPSNVDTTSLTVDSGAAITIGATDGEEPYLFTSIAGVARMADGRIAVADRGTSEIRFFDSAGRFIDAVGGTGDGPLEYRAIAVFRKIRGDSLVVADREGGRITVLDSAGTMVRRYLMARRGNDELPAPAWAVFHDGTQLVNPSDGVEMIAPGVIELRVIFKRFREGNQLVAEYDGAEQKMRMVNASLAGPNSREARGGEPPSRWATGDEHFIYAHDPRVSEWRVYSLNGTVERIVRLGGSPASAGAARDSAHIGIFTFDLEGALWVQIAEENAPATPNELWMIIDGDGLAAHKLRLPPVSMSGPARRYPVMEIGNDYVLIASMNREQAPVVLLLPLRRVSR